MLPIEGLGTALVTPFRNGAVDYAAYRALTARQVAGGADFLVPLGSTAETPCLSDEEKVKLLEITCEEAAGRPVVAGAGANSLSETIRNMRLLDPCGADAYLIVTPYYNKPGQEGLYEYFKAVAESTDRRIIMYNVPSRTGVNMTADTVARLSRIPNIAGIKEASGNVAQCTDIMMKSDADFSVLCGNDDQTLALMASGADGVISVASNIVPVMMKHLVTAIRESDLKDAAASNIALYPLFHACFVESNPIPVKAALAALGYCTSEMRLPLTEATAQTKALMADLTDSLKKVQEDKFL